MTIGNSSTVYHWRVFDGSGELDSILVVNSIAGENSELMPLSNRRIFKEFKDGRAATSSTGSILVKHNRWRYLLGK